MTDEGKTTSVERVVVALDSSSESLSVLETAAWLASAMRSRLAGLFIEDQDLFRLANLPFSQEVPITKAAARNLEPERLYQEIRARANLARHALEKQAHRHRIEWSFEIVRGRVEAEVTASTQQSDLIAVAGASGALESTGYARMPVQLLKGRFGAAVLVAARRGTMRPGPITVVLDSLEGAGALLQFASRIARAQASPLHVLISAEDVETVEKLELEVLRVVGTEASLQTRSSFGGTGQRFLERLCAVDRGCVVMAAGALGQDEQAFERLLRMQRCPIVILHDGGFTDRTPDRDEE